MPARYANATYTAASKAGQLDMVQRDLDAFQHVRNSPLSAWIRLVCRGYIDRNLGHYHSGYRDLVVFPAFSFASSRVLPRYSGAISLLFNFKPLTPPRIDRAHERDPVQKYKNTAWSISSIPYVERLSIARTPKGLLQKRLRRPPITFGSCTPYRYGPT